MSSLFVNGVEIESLFINSVEQDTAFVDGVQVFPSIDDFVLTVGSPFDPVYGYGVSFGGFGDIVPADLDGLVWEQFILSGDVVSHGFVSAAQLPGITELIMSSTEAGAPTPVTLTWNGTHYVNVSAPDWAAFFSSENGNSINVSIQKV